METTGYKFYQDLINSREDGDVELALLARADHEIKTHFIGAKDFLIDNGYENPTLENILTVASMLQKEILISSLIYAIQNKYK